MHYVVQTVLKNHKNSHLYFLNVVITSVYHPQAWQADLMVYIRPNSSYIIIYFDFNYVPRATEICSGESPQKYVIQCPSKKPKL